GRAGIRAMGIAEEYEVPFALEVGIAERLAVLVDEVERAADRAGEEGPGRAFRVVAKGEGEQPAGAEDEEPRQGDRDHHIAWRADWFLGGRRHAPGSLNDPP